MIEEHFAQGDSFIHHRDPRGKIVSAILFTVTVALLQSFPALIIAFFVSVFLLLLARLPILATIKRLLLVNGFTLFIWLTLPLSYGGEDTIDIGWLTLSHDGVILAALITLKTNTIIQAIIALLSTSTIAEIGYALEKLRFPQKLVFILLYSYRYVFVIYQEYQRLLRAAKMRAFSPRTNLHTYKTYAYLFAMTLVKSYNRSQRVHQAMLLRGFNGRLVTLHHYNFHRADTLFIVILVILDAFIISAALLH